MDITKSHIIPSSFSSANPSFQMGAVGLIFSYAINSSEQYYLEPFVNISILSDKSPIEKISGRSSQNPAEFLSVNNGAVFNDQYSMKDAAASTNHYGIGLNIYKKPNDYFGIGAGLHFTYVSTQISNEIITDSYYYNVDRYIRSSNVSSTEVLSLNKLVFSVPIILRGYLPIGDKHIRLSILGHISTQARMEASIGFCF